MARTPTYKNPKPAVMFGPGRILRDELDAREITQDDFATAIGKSRQFVNGLIGGSRRLTFEVAILLEAALGIDADLWLKMEHNYRRYQEAKLIKRVQLAVRKRVIAMPSEVTTAFMIAALKKRKFVIVKSAAAKKRRTKAASARKRRTVERTETA